MVEPEFVVVEKLGRFSLLNDAGSAREEISKVTAQRARHIPLDHQSEAAVIITGGDEIDVGYQGAMELDRKDLSMKRKNVQ